MKESCRDSYSGRAVYMYLERVQEMLPSLGKRERTEKAMASIETITAIVILGSSVSLWLMHGL